MSGELVENSITVITTNSGHNNNSNRLSLNNDEEEDNREQMMPLLISNEELPFRRKIVDGDDTPSAVSSLKSSSKEGGQTGATPFVEHPSPTHTAELMRSGGLPKNRKRPGAVGDNQRVTMTGTITKGNSVGQPVEVQLELTETERLQLTSRQPQIKDQHEFRCGRTHGPHIILWSILCIPVAMAISISISFYNGSLTWYNFIIYFSEEKTFFHKVTLCPFIILSFPVTVGVSSFLISLLASVMQISWSWPRWAVEIRDGEKGFYGWFCGKVGLPRCSPYQVVVLDGSQA